jgi:hypothetical protein
LTKKSSKKGFDSESESDDSDSSSGRGKKKKDKRGKLTKTSSKKGFDSESESDDSEYSGKKKSKLVKRNSKNNSVDSDYSESSRSEDYSVKGRGKKKLVKRNSKNNVDSDSESSEDSECWANEKKKSKKGGSRRAGASDSESESSESEEELLKKRRFKTPSKAMQKEKSWKEKVNKWAEDSEHTKEQDESLHSMQGRDKPPSSPKRPRSSDESVRQARTILNSYSTTKDQDISSQVQAAMKSEMTDVIATMKAQREVMEERLRETEREAMKLRLEQEAARKQITELETKKKETEERLQETQKEAKMVRSNSCVELAEKEGEKIIVSAELEGVRKERENMSRMIERLEQAKKDMEGRLTQAKEEATTLKAQNDESTKRVSEVEKEREAMKLKLTQSQRTRGTIEARLKEAEEEAKQLKEERKEKSEQIKRCDNNEGILHQYQSQKNTISKDLKKLETEREEMMDMLARLDKSCDSVQGQIGRTSRHSPPSIAISMDGSRTSRPPVSRSHSSRALTSHRSSAHGSKSAKPNVDRRSGMQRASSQPSLLRDEKPKERSFSWLAKEILSRSQHGIEGGDHDRSSRDSPRPLSRTQHGNGMEQESRSRDSRPLRHGSDHSLGMRSAGQLGQPTEGPRPAGWLGNEIYNRSLDDMRSGDPARRYEQPQVVVDPPRQMPKKKRSKDPSVCSRRDHADDQACCLSESASLHIKREKLRASEKRLVKEISKSKLHATPRNLLDEGSIGIPNSRDRW